MVSPIAPQRAPASGAVTKYKPDALMYALAAMTWLYVWRIQDMIPGLGAIKPSILVLIPVLVLFAQTRHPLRRLNRLRSPLTTTALVFFATVVASVPFALWPGKALGVVTGDMIPNLLLGGVVAAAVRDNRDVMWFVRVNLLGAALFAAYVFVNFEPDATGRLSDLLYYDANDFALLMVCSIPCAVLLFRAGLRSWERIAALVALAMIVLGIVQSGSRGGFLGFVAVMGYLLVRFDAIPVRQRVLSVVLGVVALLAVAGDRYWELMGTLLTPSQDYNWAGQEQGHGRFAIWKRGIGYMIRRPLTGVGARNFPQAEGTMTVESARAMAIGKGWKWSVAHNSFVEAGAELGIVGLIAFVLLFVHAFRLVKRLRPRLRGSTRSPPLTAMLAQTLAASLVGFIVCGFFVSAEYFSFLYFLLGLAAGMYKLVQYGSAAAAAPAAAGAMAARRGAFPRRISIAR